jgi:hypothetical protein
MQLYLDAKGKRIAFGHGGSDGTHAYAWPEQDLLVLYFTQSRGNSTFLEFEDAVQRLLLGGSARKTTALPQRDAKALAPYLGVYWTEAGQKPVAILYQQEHLWLEIPWQTLLELKETEQPDRWVCRLAPQLVLHFARDATGQVTSFTIEQQGQKIPFPRLQRDDTLPTVAELMKRRQASLGLDKLTSLGVFRLTGAALRNDSTKGTFTMWLEGTNRYRWEVSFGAENWEKAVVDGAKAWSANMRQAPQQIEGLRAEQARLSSLVMPLADWQHCFQEVQILKRRELDGKPVLLVRCVPRLAASRIFYVEEATGKLLAAENVELVPGLGHLGKGVEYEDYREVGGVQIPHVVRQRFASGQAGRLTLTIDKVETKVEAAKDTFLLKPEK